MSIASPSCDTQGRPESKHGCAVAVATLTSQCWGRPCTGIGSCRSPSGPAKLRNQHEGEMAVRSFPRNSRRHLGPLGCQYHLARRVTIKVILLRGSRAFQWEEGRVGVGFRGGEGGGVHAKQAIVGGSKSTPLWTRDTSVSWKGISRSPAMFETLNPRRRSPLGARWALLRGRGRTGRRCPGWKRPP